MFRWPSLCASLALLAFVSQVALGQRATISLKPLVEPVRRECVGGPNNGMSCTTTADCENDGDGDPFPECQRLCDDDPSHPCSISTDCRAEQTCNQQCFCNSVISYPWPPFEVEIWATSWFGHLAQWQVTVDFGPLWSSVRCGTGRPFPEIPCGADADCPMQYPYCTAGTCERETGDSAGCAFICDPPAEDPHPGICDTRPDYVFFGHVAFQSVDCSTPMCRLGSTTPEPGGQPLFEEPKYLATLVPEILDRAGCDITITPSPSPLSALVDPLSTLLEPLDIEGLTIETGAECYVDCNLNSKADSMEKLEPGDFDFNHTIDLADFAAFQRCFYGISYGYDDPCPCVFDFNGNLVVDRGDLHGLTSHLTGP